MSKLEKILFEGDNGAEEFYVLSSTRLAGRNYILVTDKYDDDASDVETFVMKDMSDESESEARYEMVDDEEAEQVFELLLDELED